MEREEQVPSLASSDTRKCSSQVIEGGPHIVYSVADEQGQAVWDWLRSIENNPLPPVVRVHNNFVESTPGESSPFGVKLIDVAIGPLDF